MEFSVRKPDAVVHITDVVAGGIHVCSLRIPAIVGESNHLDVCIPSCWF
jgi:hypothetical protein